MMCVVNMVNMYYGKFIRKVDNRGRFYIKGINETKPDSLFYILTNSNKNMGNNSENNNNNKLIIYDENTYKNKFGKLEEKILKKNELDSKRLDYFSNVYKTRMDKQGRINISGALAGIGVDYKNKNNKNEGLEIEVIGNKDCLIVRLYH